MTHVRFNAYMRDAQKKIQEMGGTRAAYWYGFALDRHGWDPQLWNVVMDITSEAEENIAAERVGVKPLTEERRLLQPATSFFMPEGDHPERLPAFLAFVKENMAEHSSCCSHTPNAPHKCKACLGN